MTPLRPSPPPPATDPRPRSGRRVALLLALAALFGARPAHGLAQVGPSRQVTLCGIHATPTPPGDSPKVDPKLKPIANQLRRLFPGHDFKLVGVETQRVGLNQTLTCDFGAGFVANAQLTNPLDPNGKAQFRFQLDQGGMIDFATIVNTPLNQIFFLDKPLPDGSKLIMGLGARE